MSRPKKESRYPESWGDLPSVTEVLDCIPKPGLMNWYKRTPYLEIKKSSDESKAIGTAANELIDAFEKGDGKITSIELDAAIAPKVASAVRAYMDWRKVKSLSLIGSQIKVMHKELGYVGTIDRLEKGEDGLHIIDWKVSSKFWLSNRIQVIAYKRAFEAMNSEKISKCELIRLDKKDIAFNAERDVLPVDDHDGRLFGMFVSLLNFYKEFRKEEE